MSATESPTPLRDGPDVSWIPHCHPGDSQGQIGACSVFAVASWVEVMFQRPISDDACISAYREERRRRYGGGDDGLTIPEAFFASVTAGIVPAGCYCRRVPDLAALPLAPLVAVYRSTRGWYTPNAAGCVDHTDEAEPGFHAVLLVAHGQIRAGSPSASSHKVVWIENSWGRDWGYMGFGVMSESYHRAHLDSLWQIVRQGQPTTVRELEQRQLAALAERIADPVKSIMINLGSLGYRLPCEPAIVMADIVQRSMSGTLTPAQERSKANLADVYLLLRGQGIDDATIMTVVAHIAGARTA